MRPNIAVILAGGTGKRLGLDTPKQFLEVAGKKVMEHSVDAFERHPGIAEIAIVVHPSYVAYMEDMARRNGWQKVRRVLPGGQERYDSSLAAVRAYAGRDVNLVFHDAVRPLVSQRIIGDVCEALSEHAAVAVVLPAVDTIIEADGDSIAQIPDRTRLRRAQTPQAFRREVIEKAYGRALRDPAFRVTDDCGVVVKYMPEVPVHLVTGEEGNLKLTYKEDLPLLERFFRQRENSQSHAPMPAGNPAEVLRKFVASRLRPVQLKQLGILREVDRLCRRHDIPYWIDSGTLLGAVRHGGFIPWDDDIDICVRLEDMPRLVETARRELPPHLFMQTQETDPGVRVPICKVRDLNSLIVEPSDDFSRPYAKGLYIDIFPMEPWPTMPDGFTRRVARGYSRANAILHRQHTYSLRSFAEFFYFGAKRAVCAMLWHTASLLCGKDKYYSNIIGNSGNGNRHLASTIFPLTEVEFEGERFSAPADPDRYLRDLFGDYRKLPPEEARTGHAAFFIEELFPTNPEN